MTLEVPKGKEQGLTLKALEDDAKAVADADRGEADSTDLPEEKVETEDKLGKTPEVSLADAQGVDAGKAQKAKLAQMEQAEKTETDGRLAKLEDELQGGAKDSAPNDFASGDVYDLAVDGGAPDSAEAKKPAESQKTAVVAQTEIADNKKDEAESAGSLIKEGAEGEGAT